MDHERWPFTREDFKPKQTSIGYWIWVILIFAAITVFFITTKVKILQ